MKTLLHFRSELAGSERMWLELSPMAAFLCECKKPTLFAIVALSVLVFILTATSGIYPDLMKMLSPMVGTMSTAKDQYLSTATIDRDTVSWQASPSLKQADHLVDYSPTLQDTHYSSSAVLTIAEKLEQCSQSLDISRSAVNITAAIEKTSKFLAILQSIISPTFSTHFRNPCWDNNKFSKFDKSTADRIKRVLRVRNNAIAYSDRITATLASVFKHQESMNVQCLPYFYVIGFPKCGTTSLDSALSKHSDIACPRSKELGFWNNHSHTYSDDFLSNPNSTKLVILRYLYNFQSVTTSRDKITFDGTAFTVHDATIYEGSQDFCTTPALISTITPNARFIMVMREPIDRLFSNYLFACSMRYGVNTTKWPAVMQTSPDENFHKEALASVQYFKNCVQNMSLFECANINRFKDKGLLCGKVGFRLTVSLYYVHIAKWLLYFPREQFLFLRTEDLSIQSYKVLSQVTDFLSISSVNKSMAAAWFENPANSQSRVLHSSQRFTVLPKTRTLLEDFYRPYNKMLAEVTGDIRFLWEDLEI